MSIGSLTQEDPIGLAGGLNLYGFAVGDPVNFGDPFGLKVCYGQRGRDDLVKGTQEATDATIELDSAGCIKGLTPNGEGTAAYRALVQLVGSDTTFNLLQSEFDCSTGVDKSCYDFGTFTAHVHAHQVGTKYRAKAFACGLISFSHGRHSWGSIITHELLGHALNHWGGGDLFSEGAALRLENALYHAPRGEKLQCGG